MNTTVYDNSLFLISDNEKVVFKGYIWEKWFAYYPVIVEPKYSYVWLIFVMRRKNEKYSIYDTRKYIYSIIPK